MGDREDFIVAAGAAVVVEALADEADIHSRAGNSPPGRNHRRNGEVEVEVNVAGEVEVVDMELLAVLVAAEDEAEVLELHEVEEHTEEHLRGAAISRDLKQGTKLEEHTEQERPPPLVAHTEHEEAGAEARETPVVVWEGDEERPEAGEETRASHLTEQFLKIFTRPFTKLEEERQNTKTTTYKLF